MPLDIKKYNSLTTAGKEELALAMLLWKDFKCGGKTDVDVFRKAYEFCEMLGVTAEFQELLSKVPPLKIVPRYEQPIVVDSRGTTPDLPGPGLEGE